MHPSTQIRLHAVLSRRTDLPIGVLVAFLAVLVATAPAAAQDLSLPGPFPVGTRSATVVRPNASTFTAQLFYPAASAGAAAPFNPAAAPAPVLHFGHGFLTAVSSYTSTLSHLASHGYIVIATNSASELFPSHSAYAQDISLCLTWVLQQHATPGSFLEGRVDTAAIGLSGHSMGGGASHLAAAADPRVRIIATLAAAETNPSAAAAAASISIPNFLISASADSITPLASHGQLMYNAARGPRQLPVLQGGFHCGFVDASFFGCDSGPLPRADQLALTRRLLTQIFNLHLKDDQSLWSPLWGPASRPPLQDPRINTTADPRSAITPVSASIAGAAGSTPTVQLTLTNTSTLAADFDILIDAQAWPPSAVAAPAQITGLAPGASASIPVQVTIPAAPAPATLTVSARLGADGATRSFAIVSASRPCTADWDASGVVNSADISAFLTSWLTDIAGGTFAADINGDGAVNSSDISAFITSWLAAVAVGC